MRRLIGGYGVIGLVALVAFFAPAESARPDAPSQCTVHFGSPGGNPGLAATVFSSLDYDAPAGVGAVSGSALVPLYPSWNVLFANDTLAAVTNPAITISSGLDPSAFGGQPTSCTQPALAPGATMDLRLAAPGDVHDGALGFDSSASASPSVLPAGGGEVTERFTVTVTDPSLAGANVTVSTGNGDVSVISQSIPGNLDPGEESISTNDGEWDLSDAQLGKTYVFTALVTVGNAGPSAAPYVFSPTGFIRVNNPRVCGPCGGASTIGSSVSVPDPALGGAFTFAVEEPGELWNVFRAPTVEIDYPEGNTPLSCKAGGWRAYGIFKNQGDCVSYVATGGRNPPAGA